jgi:glycosyltransferase involved in cell wall biosynthesis
MRIAIDARALGGGGGGDENYTRNIIRALASVDPDNEYTLYVTPGLPQPTIPGAERMRCVELAPKNLQARILLSMPLALARERIDVFHAQYLAPPLCPSPVVVTVHDISYEHYPQFFTPAAVLQLRALVPLTVRRAQAVLTVSEFSKRDIVRRYRVPPERVFVAHGEADPIFHQFHNEGRLAYLRQRYGIGGRFILCVANLQPRKNLKTLIASYIKLRRADASRHKLVLVGRKAWLHDEIFAAACASGYSDDLVFTGYVPDEDLVALYNAADLFVYPSIFEGFGAPPLEAMTCGTPVVTTKTSSIPEVVGDAAILVDPLDTEAMAQAIATVLHNPDLQARLTARGLQRAAGFSWDTAARTIASVYHSASRS